MPSSRTARSSRKPGGSRGRTLLLAGAGLAAAALYLALPTSSTSRSFPLRNLEDFPEEWKIYRSFPDPERRLEIYSRLNFSIPNALRDYPPEVTVLLPPRDYALRFLPLEQTHWTDPRYLYYWNYTVPGATRSAVIWGRQGYEKASLAVLLEKPEGAQVKVTLVDLREPGAWDRVEDAYRTQGGPRP